MKKAKAKTPATQPPARPLCKIMHGLNIHEPTAILVSILHFIESPFLQIQRIWREHLVELMAVTEIANLEQREAAKAVIVRKIEQRIASEVKCEARHEIELVYAFVASPDELLELIDQERAVYRDAAFAKVGPLHPKVVAELRLQCELFYFQSMLDTPSEIADWPPHLSSMI